MIRRVQEESERAAKLIPKLGNGELRNLLELYAVSGYEYIEGQVSFKDGRELGAPDKPRMHGQVCTALHGFHW
jgi:hypothetical protein